MSRTPTGRIVGTPEASVLVLSRTFDAPIGEVWEALTVSERTGRWIGTWTGEPGPGRTIDFIMSAEGVTEPSPVTITKCSPPNLLALDMAAPDGIWPVRLELAESDGGTMVTFSHALRPDEDVSSIGPGWEYYFDRLIAAETGGSMPEWDDYYPAQQEWYANLPIAE